MKTSSDFLWKLIKSLKSAEKTYFRRNFISNQDNGEKLYLKLFNAIGAQKKYDEAKILSKFSPSINKRNIAFQKNYLQNQICNAIAQYDSKDSVSHELYKQILLIRVLRKKGLIEAANSIWKKAVKKARAAELFPILTMLVTEFEKMILSGSSETQYEELYSIFKGRTITYNEYSEMITLRDIYTELLLLKRKAHFDIDDELLNRLTFLQQKINTLDIHKQTNSFWLRHYYLLSKATILYLLNDSEKSLKILTEALREWKKNTQYIIKDGEFYIELLYMINYTGVLQGSFDFVIESFNDPVNDLIEDATQKANFEAIKYLALNKIYNKRAQYKDVKELVEFMKTKNRQWEPLLNADLNRTINFSLGIASFVLEQYDDALYFVKRGNTYFQDGTREEHNAFAHILLLLISYSINNDRLFETEYRATYTYFHKRQKRHPFETALVQCLHRNFYMTDKKLKIKEYEKALHIFEENIDDPVQQISVSIFNYPNWLKSKIQNITYQKFVTEKVKSETSLP